MARVKKKTLREWDDRRDNQGDMKVAAMRELARHTTHTTTTTTTTTQEAKNKK